MKPYVSKMLNDETLEIYSVESRDTKCILLLFYIVHVAGLQVMNPSNTFK